MNVFQQNPNPNYPPDPPRVSEGMRLYVIGDIHGRADLLGSLLGQIREDAKRAEGLRKVLVFLGDYIDRGGGSFEVVELLIGGLPAGFESVHLKGNHEDFLLNFVDNGSMTLSWMMNGGIETMHSYGVDVISMFHLARNQEDIHRNFLRVLPRSHLDFFRALRIYHIEGDYLFVHAGIKPGVPLERQVERDLIWIRREFLDYPGAFPKVVVHGHTIRKVPEVRPNRIAIDTGAFITDCLTCLVLEGASLRFLQTR